MKKKYWYFWNLGSCPVCGKDESYKERRYTPKPKNENERYRTIPDTETYDWCNESNL